MQEELGKQLIKWRRDFHMYPETGFLEMRTASIVARILARLGFKLQLGKEVMAPVHCMGMPDKEEIQRHAEWARKNGADPEFLPYFQEGYTAVVGVWETGRTGPTLAFRFDMDALPIHESEEASHFPNQEGFRSRVPGRMHACGHDAHIAIGLGLATLIAENHENLQGTIKLIFQPAEEGTRGAKAMVETGVVDDVDYFIATHIGTGVPHRQFVAANNGFFATSKLDIYLKGVAAHAGGAPEAGRNALLAAANAVLNIHAIPRHSAGATRVNVGELHAGTGRNIIPDRAVLKVETRGDTSELNDYMKNQVEQIIHAAAHMYQVDYEIKLTGEARSCPCSPDLARVLAACAEEHRWIEKAILEKNERSGSEDATYFMEKVQRNGGQATYCIFGTELASGHHNEKFDINEESLLPAAEILFRSILRLTSP